MTVKWNKILLCFSIEEDEQQLFFGKEQPISMTRRQAAMLLDLFISFPSD